MLARRSLLAALGLGFIAPAFPAPPPRQAGLWSRETAERMLRKKAELGVIATPSEHTMVTNGTDRDVFIRPADYPNVDPLVLRPGESMTELCTSSA